MPAFDIDPSTVLEFTPSDLDGHWVLMPGKVLVSYQEYVSATDSYGTTHEDIQALNREIGKKEVELGDDNFAFKRIRAFTLRASTFDGVQVTKRGKITDENGVVYIVTEAHLRAWGTHWQVECYALNG